MVVMSLRTLLLLETFICSLLYRGSRNTLSQNRALIQVNGLKGGLILLQINPSSPGNMTNKIEWEFQPKGSSKIFMVVEIQEGKIIRPNPSDRFGERLEAVNETTLRIKNLQLEDGGIYEASFRLPNAEGEKSLFSLAVHMPVPQPQIHPQLASDSPEGCNVTLHCQASGPGEFSVSWRRENAPRSLEGGTEWSANGTDLHLFSKPNSLDSNFTCVVSSAFDRKAVSFDLLSKCSFEDKGRDHLPLLGLLGMLVLIPAVAFGIWQWKRRRKMLSRSGLSEGIPVAPEYAEIAKRRHPPEGNEDQDPDCCSPSLDQKRSMPTIYAQLNLPSQSLQQVT